MSTTAPTTVETRQAVLRIGLFALMQHVLDNELPVPHDIYITHDEHSRDVIRVLVSGAGQQMRWLNTVHIEDERQAPAGVPGQLRMTWALRLDCGIGFELVGARAAEVAQPLTVVPA